MDCLEFDSLLRFVDVIDDVAFLAMDLEFLGRPDLAGFFTRSYLEMTGDDAPASLRDFYFAYRAGVRAKVDCVRYLQGQGESADDARRHLEIASSHLRAAAVRLILVGGGPGTGKSTVARALAERLGAHGIEAQVISTDDVRAALVGRGELTGETGSSRRGPLHPGERRRGLRRGADAGAARAARRPHGDPGRNLARRTASATGPAGRRGVIGPHRRTGLRRTAGRHRGSDPHPHRQHLTR